MRRYLASYVLSGFTHDINRMVSEKADPKIITRYIRKKLKFLEGSPYYKITWWEDYHKPEIKADVVKEIKVDCEEEKWTLEA